MSDVTTPVNVGNPDEYTILETAETIIRVLGSSSKIVFMPLPTDDPKRRKPDITRLQSFSDFAPIVGFEQGIRQTAEYFKNLV